VLALLTGDDASSSGCPEYAPCRLVPGCILEEKHSGICIFTFVERGGRSRKPFQPTTGACMAKLSRPATKATATEDEDEDEDQDEDEDEDEDEDVPCQKCGSRGDEEAMLLCDGLGGTCPIALHTYCCDPPLQNLPAGDWFCPRCTERQAIVSRGPSVSTTAAVAAAPPLPPKAAAAPKAKAPKAKATIDATEDEDEDEDEVEVAPRAASSRPGRAAAAKASQKAKAMIASDSDDDDDEEEEDEDDDEDDDDDDQDEDEDEEEDEDYERGGGRRGAKRGAKPGGFLQKWRRPSKRPPKDPSLSQKRMAPAYNHSSLLFHSGRLHRQVLQAPTAGLLEAQPPDNAAMAAAAETSSSLVARDEWHHEPHEAHEWPLVRSIWNSKSGYKNVHYNGSRRAFKKPWQARDDWGKSLGMWRTPKEAATAYSKWLGFEAASRLAQAVEQEAQPPMTSEEALQTAAREGLTLTRSTTAAQSTHFKGVCKMGDGPRCYLAKAKGHDGLRISLGCFKSAEEAALEIARFHRREVLKHGPFLAWDHGVPVSQSVVSRPNGVMPAAQVAQNVAASLD
jgi:hypothetical protein